MWLFTGAAEDFSDKTVLVKYSSKWQYSTEMSLIVAITSVANQAQQAMAHQMIQSTKPRPNQRQSEFTAKYSK